MKIAIFGNEFQHASVGEVGHLLRLLSDSGAELWGEPAYVDFLRRELADMPPVKALASASDARADVALSIGGDGTFLRTAQAVAVHGTPIMGVNAGHLGYLTTVDISEAQKAVKCLLSGDYDTEDRTMLQLMLPPGTGLAQPFALNEVAILRQDTSSTIKLDVSLDDVALTTFKGDGMLLCTPTGSTAYNLSVGGPVLHPQSRCFVLSPISPHALTMRSVVVADTSVLRVTVRSRASVFQVSVDGETVDLPSGTTLRLVKAPFATRVIMLKGHRFARVLRKKLMWGIDNRGEE